MQYKKVILLILDGLGFRKIDTYHPFSQIKTEFFSNMQNYNGFGLLQASGIAVGLDYGEIGSSAAGHISMGTGIIYYQNYPRINLAIQNGSFYQNEVLNQVFLYAKKQNSKVHLIGLITEKPIHAHLNHLIALINLAKKYPEVTVFLHLFLDGIDELKGKSWLHLQKILSLIQNTKIKIGTLCGRFYAMDQEEVWELRTQRAFRLIVEGVGTKIDDLPKFITEAKYNIEDESILEPKVIDEKGLVENNDALIFFNFRPDGIKQLFQSFIQKDFSYFPRPTRKNLLIVSLVPYLEEIEYPVAFPPQKIKTNLTRIISEKGLAQLKITEKSKEKNLTYYFNGLYDVKHPKEIIKILPPSDKDISEKPIQRADEIINNIITALKSDLSLIVANIPCLDTIGHMGNFSLAVKAISELDQYIIKLKDNLTEDTALLITSDHGNIEQLINPITGEPDTTHNQNPVPVCLLTPKMNLQKINKPIGSLIDITPTILDLLNIEKPKEIKGQSLIKILS